MKVVKKGKAPDETYRGICNHCHSTMEAPKAELKVEDYSGLKPGEGPFAHAACLVCGKDFVLYPMGGK